MAPERTLTVYRTWIEKTLAQSIPPSDPWSLYEPMKYITSGGGKRFRSLLILLSTSLVGGIPRRAIQAGVAVELLHTFTLVHDDIMDHADARRGKPTVHKKWDANIAILAGDALLCLAYRILLRTRTEQIKEVARLFTEGVLEVCEGQAYDKEYEDRSNVSIDEYMAMIEKKTGALFRVSAHLGALLGEGSNTEVTLLSRFGRLLGRAFQIQDDLLDIIGDEKTFGKKIGGDLKEGKKTFLLLTALQRAPKRSIPLFQKVLGKKGVSESEILSIREIFKSTGVLDEAAALVDADINAAGRILSRFNGSRTYPAMRLFTNQLLNRTY